MSNFKLSPKLNTETKQQKSKFNLKTKLIVGAFSVSAIFIMLGSSSSKTQVGIASASLSTVSIATTVTSTATSDSKSTQIIKELEENKKTQQLEIDKLLNTQKDQKNEIDKLISEREKLASENTSLKDQLNKPVQPTEIIKEVPVVQPIVKKEPEPITNLPKAESGFIAGTCTYLKSIGIKRIPRGDVNYNASRDRDNDGIACE